MRDVLALQRGRGGGTSGVGVHRQVELGLGGLRVLAVVGTVGQTRSNRLASVVPRLSGHQSPPVGRLTTCLRGVDTGHVLVALVENGGILAQLRGVAPCDRGGVVDHHLRPAGHDHLVTSHRDNRRDGGGDAVNVYLDRGTVSPERVHDRHAVPNPAAGAVEVQLNLVHVQIVDFPDEIGRTDAEPTADRVHDVHLRAHLGAGIGSSLDPVPRPGRVLVDQLQKLVMRHRGSPPGSPAARPGLWCVRSRRP